MNASKRKPRIEHLVLGLVVMLWTATFVARFSYSLYDDAYIYLRYTQNVLHGCGLRFNCGDTPVEGFTSPLYLGLLVLGGFATSGRYLETLTQVFGGLGIGFTLFFAGIASGKLGEKVWPERPLSWKWLLPGSVIVILGAANHFMLNGVIGLETALGCLIVTLIFASSLDEDRLPGMRVLLLLAVLVRPEAMLFIPAVLVFRKTRQWQFWPPVVVGLIAMTALRYAIFGDFVANTYWAKSGGTAAHVRLGAEYLQMLVRDFPVILLAPLALLDQNRRRSVFFFGGVSLVWCAFFLKSGGDTFGYSRLAVPIVPGLTALGVFGALLAFDRLTLKFSSARHDVIVHSSMVIMTLGCAYDGNSLYPLADSQHGFENVLKWRQVGKFLREHHPKASLATVPIGAIGYFSQSPRVIDLVGLTSREIAKAGRSVPPDKLERHWIGHERHNTEWVIEQAPDLIIFNKWTPQPFSDPALARAGFYADWLLLRAIKEGHIPYDLYMPEVTPGVYWQMFIRRDVVEKKQP